MHPLGKREIRQAAVFLEHSQDSQIGSVERWI